MFQVVELVLALCKSDTRGPYHQIPLPDSYEVCIWQRAAAVAVPDSVTSIFITHEFMNILGISYPRIFVLLYGYSNPIYNIKLLVAITVLKYAIKREKLTGLRLGRFYILKIVTALYFLMPRFSGPIVRSNIRKW